VLNPVLGKIIMAKYKYRTTPVQTSKMPRGIPYIIMNEAAERFSFYGMRALLPIFMTEYLMSATGQFDPLSDLETVKYIAYFTAAVYAFPFIGAIISDALFGKFKTIIPLSIIYCIGHIVLTLDVVEYGMSPRTGLALGLGLIAVGSGGIKPCVSAHVGDQFCEINQNLMESVFGWFYFAINLGAFISSFLTPWLLQYFGPQVAFGIPGGLMLFATWVFYVGRNKFVHIPPSGGLPMPYFSFNLKRYFSDMRMYLGKYFKEFFSEGWKPISKLIIIYLFISMFWSLYDQAYSLWVLQAKKLDTHLNFIFFEIEPLPGQIQAINPILILIFIPVFTYWVYPLINRFIKLTPLKKIGSGLFLAIPAFLIPAWLEMRIELGHTPHIFWQIIAYIILTIAEILVSITALEFSYTQAPTKMKSIVMALFLLSVAIGNGFTGIVNWIIQAEDGSSLLSGPDYYFFFSALMLITSIIFIFVAYNYKEERHIQGEEII
jgi:POT family proton-dependent oligopeptide transporter